jgi:hypothetical protein
MRTRTTLTALGLLAAGTLLGWLAASGRIETPPAMGEKKTGATEKQPAGDGKKPNIVFILTDNLGYGEVGCYGGGILRGAPTPRIDKLATQQFFGPKPVPRERAARSRKDSPEAAIRMVLMVQLTPPGPKSQSLTRPLGPSNRAGRRP